MIYILSNINDYYKNNIYLNNLISKYFFLKLEIFFYSNSMIDFINVLFRKKNNKVLFRKKNNKKIKKRNCKKETAKKKLIKIQQDGVVGKTWVSRRGWGGRENLG